MGVMACDRSGCDHVMCDRLIKTNTTEYYICPNCADELGEVVKEWPAEMSKTAFLAKVDEFFESEKGSQQLVDPRKEFWRMMKGGRLT